MFSLKQILLDEDFIEETETFAGSLAQRGGLGTAPAATVGRAAIKQPPFAREIGFPYRNYEDEDEVDIEDEELDVDDIQIAHKFRNATDPFRIDQSLMSDPGSNYGPGRRKQMMRQATGGGKPIIFKEDNVNQLNLKGYSGKTRGRAVPGHHGAGLHQTPSKNYGAYMQGAAAAKPGQGPTGWASGIPKDNDDEEITKEFDDLPKLQQYIIRVTKRLMNELNLRSASGLNGGSSSGRFAGYHGVNSWAKGKGITNTSKFDIERFKDKDRYALLRYLSSKAHEDFIEGDSSFEDDDGKTV